MIKKKAKRRCDKKKEEGETMIKMRRRGRRKSTRAIGRS